MDLLIMFAGCWQLTSWLMALVGLLEKGGRSEWTTFAESR